VSDTSGTRYTRLINNYENTSRYHVFPDNDNDTLPSASLTVYHQPEHTLDAVFYRKDHTSPEGAGRPREPHSFGSSDDYLAYNDNYDTLPVSESGYIHKGADHDPPVVKAKENEQLQMFFHEPSGPSTVEGMFSREGVGSKVSAMTMLGMADLHSRAEFGQPLIPSHNLSDHSLRIVRHLRDVGAVDPIHVPSRTMNSSNFFSSDNLLNSDLPYRDRVRSGAVDVTGDAPRAKRHISKTMRAGKEKPKAEPEKSEQLSMPLEGWDSK
jgi:hypothetical protein